MIYIGQSKSIRNRLNRHRQELKGGIHSNPILQASWDKYGIENFEWGILEECEIEYLDDREQYYLNFVDSSFLYNILRTVGQVPKWLPNKKEYMLLKTKMIRKIKAERGALSEEERKELKERKRNETRRENGKNSQYTKTEKWLKSREDMRGVHKSTELRLKMREKNKGRMRKFTIINPHGEIIEGFGVSAFCEENNLPTKRIREVLNGKISSYHGWRLEPKIPKEKKEKEFKLEKDKKISEESKKTHNKIRNGEKPYPDLLDPNGNVVNPGINFSEFCRNNNLSRFAMLNLIKGKSKSSQGWKLA